MTFSATINQMSMTPPISLEGLSRYVAMAYLTPLEAVQAAMGCLQAPSYFDIAATHHCSTFSTLRFRTSNGHEFLLTAWCQTDMPRGVPFGDLRPFTSVTLMGNVDHSEESAAELTNIARLLTSDLRRFSQSVLESIRKLNPGLSLVSNQYFYARRNLNRVTFVLRDHPLLEKLNILSQLLELGVPADQVWFVPKQDRTKYRQEVINTMTDLGISIATSFDNRPTDVIDVICDCRPLVLIDDGGKLISEFFERTGTLEGSVASIETTSKGVHLLNRSGLSNRFVDLANAPAKRDAACDIAISCVLRFRTALQHDRLRGASCHVVGFGSIGKHVASLLQTLGAHVTISDVNDAARYSATQLGYQCFASAKEALAESKCDIVFGCSGVKSLELDYFPQSSGIVTLCSVSSQDLSDLIPSLERVAVSKTTTVNSTWYILQRGQQFRVLGGGASINLYLAEGVSEPEYDPFTSLILSTALEAGIAAAAGIFSVSGIDLARLDKTVDAVPA